MNAKHLNEPIGTTMSQQVRIGPIQDNVTDEILLKLLSKICLFTQMERKPAYRYVILTFTSPSEALNACEKLQGLQLQGRKLSVGIFKQT